MDAEGVENMIEDTLAANPGMRETYRAYGRVMHCFESLKRLSIQLESGIDVKSTEEQIERVKNHLKLAHDEVLKCLENEKALRLKLGFPPLDPLIVSQAHEFLKSHGSFELEVVG